MGSSWAYTHLNSSGKLKKDKIFEYAYAVLISYF